MNRTADISDASLSLFLRDFGSRLSSTFGITYLYKSSSLSGAARILDGEDVRAGIVVSQLTTALMSKIIKAHDSLNRDPISDRTPSQPYLHQIAARYVIGAQDFHGRRAVTADEPINQSANSATPRYTLARKDMFYHLCFENTRQRI